MGNNPTAFSDPFGLCAQASTGDSIQVLVTVQCKDGTREKQTIWAYRVTDRDQVRRVSDRASPLIGGDEVYSEEPVRKQLGTVLRGGIVYTFAMHTQDGGTVVTGGATEGTGLAFRQDVWKSLQSLVTSGSACQALGHEGVHMVQINVFGRSVKDPLNEDEARGVGWQCAR